jgi:hypothetical protein
MPTCSPFPYNSPETCSRPLPSESSNCSRQRHSTAPLPCIAPCSNAASVQRTGLSPFTLPRTLKSCSRGGRARPFVSTRMPLRLLWPQYAVQSANSGTVWRLYHQCTCHCSRRVTTRGCGRSGSLAWLEIRTSLSACSSPAANTHRTTLCPHCSKNKVDRTHRYHRSRPASRRVGSEITLPGTELVREASGSRARLRWENPTFPYAHAQQSEGTGPQRFLQSVRTARGAWMSKSSAAKHRPARRTICVLDIDLCTGHDQ